MAIRVAGALSLGLVLYMNIIVALAAATPHYLETVNRVTMEGLFRQSVFGNQTYDQAVLLGLSMLFASSLIRTNEFRACIAMAFVALVSAQLVFQLANPLLYASLASLPASILAAAFQKAIGQDSGRKRIVLSRAVTLNLVAASFLSIAIAVETASLVERIIFPSDLAQFGVSAGPQAVLESGLFHSFAILSPIILVLAAFSFLYRNYIILAAQRISRRVEHHRVKNAGKEIATTVIVHDDPNARYTPGDEDSNRNSWADWIILASAIGISIGIALYPHLPSVNPSGSGISTDERAYLAWMSGMNDRMQSGIQAVIGYAFSANGGDRPLSLLLLYGAGAATGSFPFVVRYAALVLAPAIVIASFVLARYGLAFSSWQITRRRAAIIAVFAALSPQVVVGVYAGFLANWIAFVPALLSMLFLAKAWDSDRAKMRKYVAGFFGMLLITMLCHVYMWGQLVVVASIFVALSLWSTRQKTPDFRIKTILLAVAILASVAVDIAKSDAFGVPSGLSHDTGVAGYSFNLGNFDSRWTTLSNTLWGYVGGYIAAPILLALTLFWVFKMRMSSNSLDRIMLSMLFALSIPILFGSMTIQARLLYNTPFFIPAAVVLFGISRAKLTTLLSIIMVALVMANYALDAMSNLNLVVPDNAVLENPFLVP